MNFVHQPLFDASPSQKRYEIRTYPSSSSYATRRWPPRSYPRSRIRTTEPLLFPYSFPVPNSFPGRSPLVAIRPWRSCNNILLLHPRSWDFYATAIRAIAVILRRSRGSAVIALPSRVGAVSFTRYDGHQRLRC